MKTALIGYSGFVGSTLLRQTHFDDLYRSTNIEEIRHREYDLVVCAGVPAQKWIANREPRKDLENIERLVEHLKTVHAGCFVLASTVDVFGSPVCVDENTPVDERGLHPYGLHRRHLEKFVEAQFPQHLILRLAGLVGPGLRKNIIYDFHNDNDLHVVESRNVYQFYPMVNLWYDILAALRAGLSLVHLTAEPISVSTVAQEGFGRDFSNELDRPLVRYDMQTCHAAVFGGSGRYQYRSRETLQAIRAYTQSELRREAHHGKTQGG